MLSITLQTTDVIETGSYFAGSTLLFFLKSMDNHIFGKVKFSDDSWQLTIQMPGEKLIFIESIMFCEF